MIRKWNAALSSAKRWGEVPYRVLHGDSGKRVDVSPRRPDAVGMHNHSRMSPMSYHTRGFAAAVG